LLFLSMTLPEGEATASPFLLRAEAERADLLSECLAELPARAQAVLAMRYGAGLTLRAVGAVLGVSWVAVYRIERRALDRMRAELERRGVHSYREV
jgi:RNA polymerase sigma factor (sigma-70 family)